MAAGSSSGIEVASEAIPSSSNMREDNIALENDLGTNLMSSGSRDVVITIADVTRHAPS